MRKLLVLNVAALGYDLLQAHSVTQLAGLPIRPLTTVFPAVTCTAQATLRTAAAPEVHGMTANGLYCPETRQTHFWNQSAALVKGERIWQGFREQGGRVGMYFFQQSLGESVDELLSPAPIHTHGGGMIMATYAQPAALFGGKNPVPLWRYWGPLASIKAGRGIVRALCERLNRGDAPELLFVYLPTLDYDLQRYGAQGTPKTAQVPHRKVTRAVHEAVQQIETLAETARQQGYELLICGDYAISDVTGSACFPNRLLREAGLFQTRTVRGMLYPDFHRSTAFVLCDHQVAVLYANDSTARNTAKRLIESLPEVDASATRCSEYTVTFTAKPGYWFAYPWWEKTCEAPDYATHVDIHNKPGFDPCELFFGKTPFSCSTDMTKVRGTHGRIDLPIAYATTIDLRGETLQAVACHLRTWLSASSSTPPAE